jgi:hypothetical protein
MPGSTVDISGLSFENVDFYSDAGGTLTLSNCTLSHIQGINIEDGNTNVTDSTITDSSSPYGGAILAYYGTVNVTDSTLSGNSAGYVGGAIANNGGHVIVTDSTLSGNTGNVGGAIGNTYGGTVNVSNSTLFDNTSVSEGGGGIFSNGGTVTVLSSTISMNSAPAGSNSALLGGGALFSSSGTVSVGASILAGSTSGGECSGVVTDDGFNLADDESCGLAQSTDVVSANPDLGPLANNGGATNTLLPPSNSPAVGKIPSAPSTILNGAQVCPRTDQRGVASFGKCTIGAVEGGFLITTSSLPNATPSRRYGPVTLATQEAGASVSPYVTTIKWKKVNLPKGLKLSSVGVLSGTPSRSLAAGPSSVTAQVTETVTTLKGRMKVKTKTTVQATIPLTIT